MGQKDVFYCGSRPHDVGAEVSIFNEDVYNRLRARLSANLLQLSEELVEQPSLMQEAAEGAADAIQIRDAAKNTLSSVTSEAASRLRLLTDDNGKFFSETKINSLVLSDSKVMQAVEELEEAKHSASYWTSLVESFSDRGSSLRRIADLTVSGYLTPNASYAPDVREKLTEHRRARYRPAGG